MAAVVFEVCDLRIEVRTTRKLIKSLNKIRLQETKGDLNAQITRGQICGEDQTTL